MQLQGLLHRPAADLVPGVQFSFSCFERTCLHLTNGCDSGKGSTLNPTGYLVRAGLNDTSGNVVFLPEASDCVLNANGCHFFRSFVMASVTALGHFYLNFTGLFPVSARPCRSRCRVGNQQLVLPGSDLASRRFYESLWNERNCRPRTVDVPGLSSLEPVRSARR